VLAGGAAAAARAWAGLGPSTRNGRGRRAWHDHLVVVPVRGAGDDLLAVCWVDDPVDRLVPHHTVLRALRSIAAKAAIALAWGRRVPATHAPRAAA
jgi:hypothetical protein